MTVDVSAASVSAADEGFKNVKRSHESLVADSDVSKEEKKKKKKSRWGGEAEKASAPVPLVAANLPKDKQEALIARFRIIEINKLLTSGLGILIDPSNRSPSPEPIYDNRGIRINTREFRTRKKLEEERQILVQRVMQLDPTFQPPPGLRGESSVIEDRIDIPQDQYPEINFIGLLIGPRGNTLKEMEKASGAKIMIRGKGSVKPGKGRQGGQPVPGEDEELHALIRAPDELSFKRAIEKINKIIKMAIECPEEQNQLKKQQLELLAKMNGTYREDSIFSGCGNCGSAEHRDWQCPERKNAVAAIVCSICGGAGHIEADCLQKNKQNPTIDKAKMDREFALFLKDLGEDVPEELLSDPAPEDKQSEDPQSQPSATNPSSISGDLPAGLLLSAPAPPHAYPPGPPSYLPMSHPFMMPQPYAHPAMQPYHPWPPHSVGPLHSHGYPLGPSTSPAAPWPAMSGAGYIYPMAPVGVAADCPPPPSSGSPPPPPQGQPQPPPPS
ncbi:splicing factor 1-like [Zophobas morio]|uniref:splicing factor 1-like n=1 Tax=Zophobas morio TaxID=2755281 RepID=UPI00308297F1